MAKASEWAARVAEWRASGVTAKDFCAGRGYAPSSLLGWSSRLGREKKRSEQTRAKRSTVRFARVVRSGPHRSAEVPAALLVEVGGARIHVNGRADSEALRAVFDALRLSARGAP
jgi:hypothetical protein